MRANRLLSLMFLLQSKGRMTAEELSMALNVSKRTIYRDIDALTLAGIPIYTQGGRHGGIYLDTHYRISLNSLGRDEIQSLFISSTQGPIRDIGLNDAIENALLKLLAALPLRYRDEAERIRQRVHFDPSQWFYQRDVSQWMPQLLQAVFENRKLHLRYFSSGTTLSERVLSPYGIVAKLDIWYLVAMTHENTMRTFRVSRFLSLEMLDEIFERLPSFDLIEYWEKSTRQYEKSKPRYILKIRVKPEKPGIIRWLQEVYGAQTQEPDLDGQILLTLQLGAMQEARMVVMALGNQIEIVEPLSLRNEILSWLNILQDHYIK